MAEENTELEVQNEAPAEAPVKEAPADNEEVSADIGIDALKIQLDKEKRRANEERAARVEAERRASHMERQANRSEVDIQEGNLNLVVSAIETIKRDNMMAKRAYAEAMAAGNFEAAAEANEIIAINGSKLVQLENGKAALEARVNSAKAESQKPQRPPQMEDPVEAIASQLSPRSAAWVREHPEFVRDGRRYTKMIGAHNMAIGDGLVADTDEYFDYIERTLGVSKEPARRSDEADEEPVSAAAKPAQRRSPPPAAPPSRGGTNGRSIRLTPEQREAASISGLTEEEYAANLAAEQKRRSH